MIHDLSQSYILSEYEIIINFLNIPQEYFWRALDIPYTRYLSSAVNSIKEVFVMCLITTTPES